MSYSIDRDVAIEEFDRWADANDIEQDLDGLDENDRRDMAAQKAVIVRAIQREKVTVSDDGVLTFHSKNDPKEITFYEPTGAAYVAMDKRKKSQDFGKMFASMAEITGVNAVTFSRMVNSELKVCIAVWSYFLA